MKILQINSSLQGERSHSTYLANAIVSRLRLMHPDATLNVRGLGRNPHPTLDEAALQALFTAAEERTAAQRERVALDDALITDLQASDTVVLGVPMYNFGVPAQLKNWIDAIARAGVTFRYGTNGAEGLLTGKRVYVALSRGGIYRDTPSDSQVPYLTSVLSFLGMTDVVFVYAEGMSMGPAAVEQGLASAMDQINDVFTTA